MPPVNDVTSPSPTSLGTERLNDLGKKDVDSKETLAAKKEKAEQAKADRDALLSDLRKIEKYLLPIASSEKVVIDTTLNEKTRGEEVEARKELHASLAQIVKHVNAIQLKRPLVV